MPAPTPRVRPASHFAPREIDWLWLARLGQGKLDVNDEEARALLLSIDPLAALAETQEQFRDRLVEIAPAISPDLRTAWEAAAIAHLGPPYDPDRRGVDPGPEQWLVLITCRDEKHQVELLTRFQAEGLDCRALMS
jgi:hypothetical protein